MESSSQTCLNRIILFLTFSNLKFLINANLRGIFPYIVYLFSAYLLTKGAANSDSIILNIFIAFGTSQLFF